MSGRDPIELLRELARAERASFESTADADELLTKLRERKSGRFRAWVGRRRRWVAGIITVLVGAGGGTVAWAFVHRERATSPTTIQCYIEPRLGASGFVVLADGTEPTALCASRWPSEPEFGSVPSQLVACKGPDGGAVVFPGAEDVCAELGLPVLDPTLSGQDHAIVAFQNQLAETMVSLGCVPPDEVANLARQTASEVGLVGWTITVEEPTTEQPCGRFGVDPVERVIYIQLLPDIFGGDEGG